MPSTLIEVRRHYTPAAAAALIDAVQGALVEAFKIPAWDRAVRLVRHLARVRCSPRGVSAGQNPRDFPYTLRFLRSVRARPAFARYGSSELP